ncbi:GNAT family N-acetyltransferase [uncultured Chryseobacterium sp.]|uniref:GNAT family N-acetyltransferase n=1 Tax=uncultured Chryseobacterium sp. TaxID=259322 RepID=UPI0025F660F3|nr:GNAT family N-acetyltransferase [uncultured Chryseobacterium sp.]
MQETYPIQIIPFSDDLQDHIKILNYEWLEKYFRIEEGDRVSLSDPKKEIIEKGGFIFYAKLNGEIVGTASLLKKSGTVFELGKMAVSGKAQGHGIGTVLLEHCLKFAEELSIEKLVLYSNTRLQSAIHLYKKYGFQEVPLEPGLYERADIKMEKHLM